MSSPETTSQGEQESSNIPLTNGSIVWTEDASSTAQTVVLDYSAALRKRSEEQAQLNLSTTVSTHYVDTAAKQLRLRPTKRKGAALFSNFGSLLAGGAGSAFYATVTTDSPDAIVLSVSAIVLAVGASMLVFGSTGSD